MIEKRALPNKNLNHNNSMQLLSALFIFTQETILTRKWTNS